MLKKISRPIHLLTILLIAGCSSSSNTDAHTVGSQSNVPISFRAKPKGLVGFVGDGERDIVGAFDYCRNNSGHLPSAREVAQYASDYGAVGIRETKYIGVSTSDPNVKSEINEMAQSGYQPIYYHSHTTGQTIVDFYFNGAGYQPLEDDSLVGNDIWTTTSFSYPLQGASLDLYFALFHNSSKFSGEAFKYSHYVTGPNYPVEWTDQKFRCWPGPAPAVSSNCASSTMISTATINYDYYGRNEISMDIPFSPSAIKGNCDSGVTFQLVSTSANIDPASKDMSTICSPADGDFAISVYGTCSNGRQFIGLAKIPVTSATGLKPNSCELNRPLPPDAPKQIVISGYDQPMVISGACYDPNPANH